MGSSYQINSSMSHQPLPAWLDQVRWDGNGLVPAIAQEATSGDVLMLDVSAAKLHSTCPPVCIRPDQPLHRI